MNDLITLDAGGPPKTILGSILKVWVPGMIITEPGAYIGMPLEVYHGQPCDGPSISSTGLRKIFNESPAHYWNTSSLNPDKEETPQTEALILGRAAHHLLLGEKDFGQYFVERPQKAPDGRDWHGANKSCIAWLDDRANEGLTVLKHEQVDYVRGMELALANDPIVAGGILNGDVEISLFWRDTETGIWLKVRPDTIPNASGDVADLKCVSSVDDDFIEKALGERGYHQQGALVAEGFHNVLPFELEHFNLVYVEQKRPHCVRIDEVAPEEIKAGAEENRWALRLFKHCLETGVWPGPKNFMGDGGLIRRKPWALKKAADRIAIIEQELAAP